MDRNNAEHHLAAVLSADVSGYSLMISEDEAGTVRTLAAYRDEVSLLVGQHAGRVVDFTGDCFLAEFPSALGATRCALEIQAVLRARNAQLAAGRRLEFRMGIHLGDVRVEGDRIYGDGVNIAARLQDVADPGGLCISGPVHSQVRSKLELTWKDLGEQSFKNIPERLRVFRATDPATVATLPAGRRRAGAALGIAAAAAVAVLAGVWVFGPGLPWLPGSSGTEAVSAPSLVVLPFANMSGDPEQEYFSDGITEDLITELAQLSGLLVIARNSAFSYKDRAVRVQDVARDLGVRYVLEGSVRKVGERVRITAQLVDATTGMHLWAERFDRRLEDIFAVQDEVTARIVAALQVELTEDERLRPSRPPTSNLEAYDLYLRGVSLSFRLTPGSVTRARELLERATELDPQFADAWARLALTYAVPWLAHWTDDPEVLERALELSERALEIDPSDARALSTSSLVSLFAGRLDQALARARRAVELGPNDAAAHTSLGTALNHHGLNDEALEVLAKAVKLDPQNFLASFQLGNAHAALGRFDEAVLSLTRSLDLNPAFLSTRLNLAAAYEGTGRETQAQAQLSELLRVAPGFSPRAALSRLPFRDPTSIDPVVAAFERLIERRDQSLNSTRIAR